MKNQLTIGNGSDKNSFQLPKVKHLSFRNSLLKLVDAVIERILALQDYFVGARRITVSETLLFVFASLWFAEFLIFDVQGSSPV